MVDRLVNKFAKSCFGFMIGNALGCKDVATEHSWCRLALFMNAPVYIVWSQKMSRGAVLAEMYLALYVIKATSVRCLELQGMMLPIEKCNRPDIDFWFACPVESESTNYCIGWREMRFVR